MGSILSGLQNLRFLNLFCRNRKPVATKLRGAERRPQQSSRDAILGDKTRRDSVICYRVGLRRSKRSGA
jgi:hypothetical protein